MKDASTPAPGTTAPGLGAKGLPWGHERCPPAWHASLVSLQTPCREVQLAGATGDASCILVLLIHLPS